MKWHWNQIYEHHYVFLLKPRVLACIPCCKLPWPHHVKLAKHVSYANDKRHQVPEMGWCFLYKKQKPSSKWLLLGRTTLLWTHFRLQRLMWAEIYTWCPGRITPGIDHHFMPGGHPLTICRSPTRALAMLIHGGCVQTQTISPLLSLWSNYTIQSNTNAQFPLTTGVRVPGAESGTV